MAPKSLQDFARLALIEDGHGHWTRLFAKAGLSAPKMLRFNHTALAIDAAINGQGVAMAPSLLLNQDLSQNRLTALWQPAPDASIAYHMVRRAARNPGKARQTVTDWLLGQASQPPAT